MRLASFSELMNESSSRHVEQLCSFALVSVAGFEGSVDGEGFELVS